MSIGWAGVVVSFMSIMFGAGGFFTAVAEKRKRKADASLIESQAAMNYAGLANSWIDRLEEKVATLEKRITELQSTVSLYEDEIHRLTIALRDEREKNGTDIPGEHSRSIDYTVTGHIATNSSSSNED